MKHINIGLCVLLMVFMLPLHSMAEFKTESVLASGNWLKLKVDKAGVYKLTYDALTDAGWDLSQTDPRNIRMYTYPNGMLPELNSQYCTDDLIEMPITVMGESDGIFDTEDYILFYGQDSRHWKVNMFKQIIEHTTNVYDNFVYYYLTADMGAGKRIETFSFDDFADESVFEYHDYAIHEKEWVNLIKSGKNWYGEDFETSTTYTFDFDFPGIKHATEAELSFAYAIRSPEASSIDILINNSLLHNQEISGLNFSSATYAIGGTKDLAFFPDGDQLSVTIEYHPSSAASRGWIDYVRLNVTRNLVFAGEQQQVRNIEIEPNGQSVKFVMDDGNNISDIWDITHIGSIYKPGTKLNGEDKMQWTCTYDTIREFIVFDDQSYLTPTIEGTVANQNLHAVQPADAIIIIHPDFKEQAVELGDLHLERDQLSYVVADIFDIYNEYSGGKQDVTGIRNFIKMLYQRASEENKPRYVLLFGDGSYDYKDRVEKNSNFVPTYQSDESLRETLSFVTDDYFGIMDETEGINSFGVVDLGVGRFPVKSLEEADVAVAKVRYYMEQSPVVMNDWRNKIVFVGDDEDNNLHFKQAERLSTILDTAYRDYNLQKIYYDAYAQVSTSGGDRYPEVYDAILKAVDEGALIVNYTGHGGETGWGEESVLDIPGIQSMDNLDNMPVFVTATCSFSRFDEPSFTSGGELVFLNPKGGGIALFTTTRLAYAQSNFQLNQRFYLSAFERMDGEIPRLGDLNRFAKDNSASNIKNFVLLGDPMLKMAYPEYVVKVDSLYLQPEPIAADTAYAMSTITINGHIENYNEAVMDNFNGMLYTKLFDKAGSYYTLGNDPSSKVKEFLVQDRLLANGTCHIENGYYEYSFVVPKDINYEYGLAKLSFYGVDTNVYVDANGYHEFVLGGLDESVIADNTGPEIFAYINDPSFVKGDATNENPVFYAELFDENGINSVGSGIGHDLMLVLDDDYANSICLNEYFEQNPEDYREGSVYFQFFDLDAGLHTLSFKSWDNFNNSSEQYLEFFVDKSALMELQSVVNYPNPFAESTCFRFVHNKSDEELDVSIEIYNMNGQLIKILRSEVQSSGYEAEPICWDGKAENGMELPAGVYVYRLYVRNKENITGHQIQKLVIAN